MVSVYEMPRSKQKFKSNPAADKALRKISVDLVQQLDLFDTTLHLHAMDGLTPLETEKLGNSYNTELERKQYLVTTVIPSKGHYKGMRLLRRALKQTEQYEILNTLEKAYEDAVDTIIAEKLRLSQKFLEVKHKTGENYAIQATASNCSDSITSAMFSNVDSVYRDDGDDVKASRNTDRPASSTSSSSSDDDDDDVISLDSPLQEQPQSHVTSNVTTTTTKTGENYPIQATASNCSNSITSAMLSNVDSVDGGYVKTSRNFDRPTSFTNNNSSDNDDDVISLDSPLQEQSQSHDVTNQIPYNTTTTTTTTTTVTVTHSPHRSRTYHISHRSSPYKSPKQTLSVTVNVHENVNSDHTDRHGTVSNVNVN